MKILYVKRADHRALEVFYLDNFYPLVAVAALAATVKGADLAANAAEAQNGLSDAESNLFI